MLLISSDSIKAWKRVRSWPTAPRAYSFSMVQQDWQYVLKQIYRLYFHI